MTKEEIIKAANNDFEIEAVDIRDELDFYKVYRAGIIYGQNHPKLSWISIKDDLPFNHEELLNAKYETKEVFILKPGGFPDIDYMLKVDGKWIWFTNKNPEFWMPIPPFAE